MQRNIVIVGAGLAGMVAAYMAQQEGAEVVLIDKGTIGLGTNSSLSNGVFAGPTLSCSSDAYMQDVIEAGRHINRQSVVRLIAQEAPHAFQSLRSVGIHLRETSSHHIVESPLPDVIPGVALMKKLSEALGNNGMIHVMKGFYVTELLIREDRVWGVKGINRIGKEISIHSPAVVLATGGAGAIYLRNDNQRGIMGQGYYLAARAGLQLWDMEFIQFYPLVIAEPHLPQLIMYPPFPKEVKLINASGEDIIEKYSLGDINRAVRTQRDEISAWLFGETQVGPVYMDLRNVPDPLWKIHPLSLLKKLKFDFRSKPVAVSPAAHFCMGGVRTDERGQTDLKGLFACGEIVWGLHGANRLGGNALTECVVTGSIAGRYAAQYSRNIQAVPLCNEEYTKTSVSQRLSSKADLRGLLRSIREVAWNHAGVIRFEEGMKEGLIKVKEVKKQLKASIPIDPIEKILRDDLTSALFVLEAILMAGIGREESRGSFIRKDFPREDNINWRKNSRLQYDSEKDRFSIDYISGSGNRF